MEGTLGRTNGKNYPKKSEGKIKKTSKLSPYCCLHFLRKLSQFHRDSSHKVINIPLNTHTPYFNSMRFTKLPSSETQMTTVTQ